MRWLAAILVTLSTCAAPPAARAPGKYAVASPEPLATSIAIEILKRQGNAVDAAVALGFAIAVTYPEAGNLGGGGFILVRHRGEHHLVDCREVAPRKASRDMYLDSKGEVVPDRSTIGPLAAGVPGQVMGLWVAHRRFGRLPWADLVRPAIRLAREGFLPGPRLERSVRSHLEQFRGRTNFETYFGGVKEGQTFRQPDLAQTLERIAKEGADGFYRGETARRVGQSMRRLGGLIDEEDLAAYTARIRRPIVARIGDLGIEVVTTPPPSSGGIALVQLLKMSGRWKEELLRAGHNTAPYLHLIAEIEKRVFADRAHFLGDPDFVRVPVDALTSDRYCALRASEVNRSAVSPTEQVKPGLPESPETTHYSVLDPEGNAVSHTTTINSGFGSGVVVEGAGFLLNNEMDDFSAKAGVPNIYGVVGADANAIAPGKRMLSSMCPTMIYGRDRDLITGTPGGPTIFTSVFQVALNVYLFGMDLGKAMEAPRFHHQLLPRDRMDVEEGRFAADTLSVLAKMGYQIHPRRPIGDVHSVLVGAAVEAVSDPRGSGRAEAGGE